MKRARRWGNGIFFMAIVQSLFLLQAWGAGDVMKTDPPKTADAGYLENISFEKLPGKERVKFSFSRHSVVVVEQAGDNVSDQTGSAVSVRMENVFVPEGLRRALGETALTNVIRVTPVQKSDKEGLWAIATISLKQKAPFSIREEGLNVIVDFNVASLSSLPEVEVKQAVAALPVISNQKKPGSLEGQAYRRGTGALEGERKGAPPAVNASRIVLDVQDADIKAVFRLLAEQGNVNIVFGDEVKGTVTLNLKDVSWEQALDTILTITGLGKRQVGNVITVMSLERIKKAEDDRVALAKKEEADQLKEPLITRVVPVAYNNPEALKKNVEDLLKETKDRDPKDPKQPTDSKAASNPGSVTVDNHTNSLIIRATRSDMDSLLRFIERIDKPTSQILIKANIVETTKDTARNLGIQWGGMWGQKIGSQGLYVTPGGTGGSTTPPGSAFSGGYSPTSQSVGIAGQGYGVNFPAEKMTGTASGALGLIFGTIGENILEVQLSALQKDGKVNILSSPSITTLDNQMAFTENGQKVPYVTTESGTGGITRSVKFENAVLRLEITPHVIDGKNLKMKILVQKDEIDQTAASVDGNPVLKKRQTNTNLIVQDGETIVISGLTKETKSDGTSGIPWLQDIPVLGWLFKGEGKSTNMDEVLIFITPTIFKPQEAGGIQDGA